ncbi:MAG: Ig-like domain-containing protein, partial [Anaeromyxobacteraceae bacterium]
YSKPVEDEVTISQGVYDPTTIGLAAAATSSDLVTLPALTLVEYGPMVGGAFTGTLLPPPATLRVLSSAGGVAEYQVTTTLGSTAVSPVPVAVNDIATVPEDCSALASITLCPTPLVIAPLANDTVNGGPITFGPGVTLTLVNAPRFGTATVNVDGTISYRPNLNANGVDGFSYTVNVTDAAGVVQRSNVAGVTVTITPVNDTPVAVGDTASALVNKALAINVLANDTDPDFPADTLAIASVTQPVGPVGAIATAAIGGVGATAVNFTANLAGTYTFTYRAQDLAGALSNVGTVTVTVAGAETLTITPPVQYIVASARWRLSGTDLPAAGQTLTMQYLDGPNKGFAVVSGFPVDALGNWVIDIRGATGILNPTTAGATQVIVFSSTGAVATAPITLK